VSAFQVQCLASGECKTLPRALLADLYRIAQVEREISVVELHVDEFLGKDPGGKPISKWFDFKLHTLHGSAIYWHAVERTAHLDLVRLEREEVARGRGCELRLWTFADLYADPTAFSRAKAKYLWLTYQASEDLPGAKEQIVAAVRGKGRISVAKLASTLSIKIETALVASLQLWKEGKVDEVATSPVSSRLELLPRDV